MTEVLSKDFGKGQPYRKRDMSDTSQHQYNPPPPDIMPKGLAIDQWYAIKYIKHCRYRKLVFNAIVKSIGKNKNKK